MMTLQEYAHNIGKFPTDLTRRDINKFFRLIGENEKFLKSAIRWINRQEKSGMIIDCGYGGLEYYYTLERKLTDIVNSVY